MTERPVNFESAAERNAWIIQHADYFVAFRMLDRQRHRHETKTIEEARAYAHTLLSLNSKPVMIYAVSSVGDTFVEAVKPKEQSHG